jgi:MarR family transcriptional regulator for hemolysin
LIERRADPNDRRANRLYLKPAAKPLLDRLSDLGADMMEIVLDGISAASIERTLKELGSVKDNLRAAIARNANQQQAVAG